MTKKNKKHMGFTLVEVMVVVIIIAVLAAVAIPLMTGNVKRAVATEGIAGLGTIRSNMRAMLAETGSYDKNPEGDTVSDPIDDVPGFSEGDLTGRYFDDNDYSFVTVNESNFVAKVEGDGDDSAAKGADRADGFIIWMTSQGTIRLGGEAGNETQPGVTD